MNALHTRAVVESFYADIWNRHDKPTIPALLRDNFTFRGSLGQAKVATTEALLRGGMEGAAIHNPRTAVTNGQA